MEFGDLFWLSYQIRRWGFGRRIAESSGIVEGNVKPTVKGLGRIFVIGWKMIYPSL